MRNIIGKSVLWGMCGMLLASCQTFQHARETANIRYSAPKLGSTVATVYCEGTANCEFERINNIVIVDESTHLINPSAIGQGYVRLKQRSTFDSNAIFLTLPAQQHEVVIRFYPISPDRAEKINVIQNFKPNKHYKFVMYRDRIKRSNNLLSVSVPDPLCVKLMENEKVIRRFCKPYNVLNGLGEFIEQKAG
ncbi:MULTISPECIES: hypothetical protein [Acinetobacter]|jgi:hypothetical protein|uniref:Lipoprotein n=1 Tax=Acinetobacter pollinis TaxID=2605270 RepID=A0ABU6DS23_9GAMM|nr:MULTISPECIES: hypothetical protein [Acinetobacter]MBF7689738.1 hypothetical protein [Acinetobacter pollinis]MBF7692242.1 hypothetical protein [Acinetobacter pollinis]MBF7697150.1 hypothetical protein [Acinetobacter pollinis]MBF7700201.1 hypothetical protein [Acinetobacter pollinis]MEB5476636.1 hypothetical protein [Acinetobacter pollinis]